MNNIELGRNIEIAGPDAHYDEYAKKLLSHKIVLAHIMHACLEEYREVSPEIIAERYIEQPQVGKSGVLPGTSAVQTTELIRGGSSVETIPGEGKITYDILFHAGTPQSVRKNKLIINVEAQNDYQPGYPLETRGIYYCSRLLSAQYGREFSHSEYGKIKKVYSIWICINPPRAYRNSLAKYELTEKLLVGGRPRQKKNYDLCTVIMVGLGSPEEKNYQGIIKLLGTLLSDRLSVAAKKNILEESFGMSMSSGMIKEAENMCNLSQGIYDRGVEDGLAKGIKQGMLQGMEKGMEKGMEEGLAQGRKEGLEEGLARGAKQVIAMVLKLHAGGWTADSIAEVAGVGIEQIKEWLTAEQQ